MGGAALGDGEEPVQVNVTPLIDVIFCLCLFFMCSFHFKQLEGKLDSWLPRDRGRRDVPVSAHFPLDEIRVSARLDGSGAIVYAYGARSVARLAELEELCVQGYAELRAARKDDAAVVVEGDPRAPWRAVLAVIDRLKLRGIDRVQLADVGATVAAR